MQARTAPKPFHSVICGNNQACFQKADYNEVDPTVIFYDD